MTRRREKFETRQYMVDPYFEFHHYYDEEPLSVPLHQHTFYELYFFISGNVSYHIEGKDYHLLPGDILITNDMDIHGPVIMPGLPYERIVIWLSPEFFDALAPLGTPFRDFFIETASRDYRLIRPDPRSGRRLMDLCGQIADLKHDDAFGGKALYGARMIELLTYLGRAVQETPDLAMPDVTEDERINRVLDYINARLTEDLSLKEISEAFYISDKYLCRRFRKYTGLSVYSYITKKRLITARNMIRDGAPVLTACMDSGFNDYSNFLKVFKREFGHLPSMLKENRSE